MSAEQGPVVVRIPNGQFVQNCYLVADPATREAVMVDPGEEAERFLAELARRGWTLTAVWLTHAHVDHVLGVQAVKDATGVPVHLHPADRPIYDALPQFGAWVGRPLAVPPAPDGELAHGQRVRVGAYEFEVRHAPGHSPGSVAFVGHGRVFAGDVLFAGSVGRTDLPGGDPATLLRSIREQLLSLPDATIVHSGHGPDTTIGTERTTNPFLTGAYGLG
ncbi:MAG TPA: MBL fold metallo-hydrolase [Gemmatimonadales bacterium]|nr:MBL fold metallo-hydrolase [Gemmatimonadales bacterium]